MLACCFPSDSHRETAGSCAGSVSAGLATMKRVGHVGADMHPFRVKRVAGCRAETPWSPARHVRDHGRKTLSGASVYSAALFSALFCYLVCSAGSPRTPAFSRRPALLSWRTSKASSRCVSLVHTSLDTFHPVERIELQGSAEVVPEAQHRLR